MRLGSKRLMIGGASLVMAAALVAPSFAAKKAVSDEEMDMVTAAGQPTIIQAGFDATVSFTATTDIASTIQTGSQATLRALALNNVVGENQVANGINISAGSGGATLTNDIVQSWGATADIDIVTATGGGATATFTCGADTLICKVTTTATKGANASIRQTSAADVIFSTGDSLTLTYNPTTAIAATIEAGSQSSLVALVVNNVTGLNQVGNGVNLSTATLTLGPELSATNGTGAGASQVNNLAAYRGTPVGFRTP